MQSDEFGKFLGGRLKRIGWRQKDLARHLGVLPSTVSQWHIGYALPARTLIIPLANALRCKPDDILKRIS